MAEYQDRRGPWWLSDIHFNRSNQTTSPTPPPITQYPSMIAGYYVGQGDLTGVTSSIEKVTYANDTLLSVPIANSATEILAAASGNTTDAWYFGGSNYFGFGLLPSTTINISNNITKLSYATSTSGLAIAGSCERLAGSSSSGNNTAGWQYGGASSYKGSTYAWDNHSTISRITYATSLVVSTNRASLERERFLTTAVNNNSYGWIIAGVYNTGSVNIYPPTNSAISRFTYSADTNNATQRSFSASRFMAASTANVTDAWNFGGRVDSSTGNNFNDAVSSTHRFTFATDTSNATTRGNLVSPVAGLASSGNLTHGWLSGGMPANNSSSVQRVSYANDTSTAAQRGNLNSNKIWHASVNTIIGGV